MRVGNGEDFDEGAGMWESNAKRCKAKRGDKLSVRFRTREDVRFHTVKTRMRKSKNAQEHRETNVYVNIPVDLCLPKNWAFVDAGFGGAFRLVLSRCKR